MKTKHLCVALILSLLAFQACTTDDVSFTEDSGPDDKSNLYTIKDNAFGEYLKYLKVTGVYSQTTTEDGNAVTSYVIDTVESKEFTGDINLSKTEASITKLQKAGLTTAADKIQDVDGIQFLTGLNSLALTSNNITSLDISKLVNFTELKMNFNKVGSLDLTHNTKLVTFNYRGSGEAAEGQKLTSIDLSKNTELTSLDLRVHELTNIDLSQNKKLTSVSLSDNPGAPFTIPEEIYNNLTTKDGVEGGDVPTPPVTDEYYIIPDKALGEYLNYRLEGKGIVVEENGSYKIDKKKAASYTGELNLSKNGKIPTELENAGLSTAKDKLTDLDGIQFFTGITSLTLVTNNVTEIDVSTLINLETLDLNNNKISSLDVTKNTKLKTLRCKASTQASDSQKLITIDLSKNLELTTLDLINNKLESIDLSKNTKLTSIKLSENPGTPFTIPAEIYDNLSTADGVQK